MFDELDWIYYFIAKFKQIQNVGLMSLVYLEFVLAS